MLVESGFKIGDACLESLDLFKQSEHDQTDGGRSRLPVYWGNARWWSKLMHRESILKTVKWSSPLCVNIGLPDLPERLPLAHTL